MTHTAIRHTLSTLAAIALVFAAIGAAVAKDALKATRDSGEIGILLPSLGKTRQEWKASKDSKPVVIDSVIHFEFDKAASPRP